MERRLAAILAADVVGYSYLMGADEAGTLEHLKRLRRELVQPKISARKGRIVKLMGDGLLAEFPSVVEAVQCAVDIQNEMGQRESHRPDAERIRLRIGVNVGDIISEGDDIYGEGVNVAARLESLAEPHGICLSGDAYRQVRGKLDFGFEDLGEQYVKNIAEPVAVYRVLFDGEVPNKALKSTHRGLTTVQLIGTVLVAVLIGVVGVSLFWRPWAPVVEPASIDRMAFPLPEKPSIAVLPFTNLSDDPGQEYFADGMTEDLITNLSKVSGLFVIARSSSFAYKGESPPVRKVAEELGVRYVLEGSVRRAGDTVRINTQLIDAKTGGHLWAERYDGVMTDVFALQDEVTSKIISALAVRLTDPEKLNLTRIPTDNLEAYDYFLRAERGLFSQNSQGLSEALSLYRRATEIDPTFAGAWAGHARAAVDVMRFDWFDLLPGHVARRQAYDSAARALSLDPTSSRAYSVLAILQMVDGRYDEATESASKAVLLNPNNADAHLNLALVLAYGGEHDESVRTMTVALRLNPRPPSGFYRLCGLILFMARHYEEAIDLLIEGRNATPSDPSYEEFAMAYAQLGRLDEAKAEVDDLLMLWPAANLAYYRVLYAHYKRKEDLELRVNALAKAGVPEWPYNFDGGAENRLKGSEVKRLVYGRYWYGSRVGADEFIRENTDEGIVRFRDPKAHPGRTTSSYMLEGTLSIEGDMLCYRYEEFLLGRRYCGYIFRNPEGSHEEKNLYVDVNAVVVDYFTVSP